MFLSKGNLLKSIPVTQTKKRMRKKLFGDSRENRELELRINEQRDQRAPDFFNGSKETVKILNQNCVICFERESDYAFPLCGYHYIC